LPSQPSDRRTGQPALGNVVPFPLGATLVLNVVASVALVSLWLLARSGATSSSVATDPICRMSVDTSAPAATRHVHGVDYYFCSPRCAERFDERGASGVGDPAGDTMGSV